MSNLSSTLSLNDQMTTVLTKLADTLDTCVSRFDELQGLCNNPIDDTSFKRAESSISSMGDAVDNASKQMNQAGDTMTDVAGDEQSLTNESGKLEKALNDAGDGAEKASSKLSKVGSVLKTVGQATAIATGAVVAGAAAAGKKLWSMANDTAQAGDEIEKNAQKVGLSFGSYQKWNYVMELAGTEMSACTIGLKTLTNTFDDAINGSSSATEKFNRLGISMDDIKGMSREDLFGTVVTALQNVSDETERAALANDMFGRSGQELIPLFNMTEAELQKAMEECDEYGMIMSDEAVSASAAFQDSLTKLGGAADGLKNKMIGGLLPGLTEMIDGFAALVAGDANAGSMIENGLGHALEYLNSMIPQAVSLLSSMVSAVLQAAPAIIESLATGLLSAIDQLAPVAGELITKLLSAIFSLLPQVYSTGISLIVTLVSSISSQLPQLIPAAVDAVVTIAQSLIDNLDLLLDAALQLVLALADGILAALPDLISRLPEIIVGICDFLIGAIPQIISAGMDLLGSLLDNIGGIIAALIPAIQAIIYGLINALISHAGEFIGAGLKLLVSLIGALPTAIAQICAAIPQIVVSMINNFLSFVGGFVDAGWQLLKGLWNGIKDAGAWVVERIKGLGKTILNGIKSIFGIHSPSTEMAWVGEMLGAGLVEGMTASETVVSKAANHLAGRVLNATDGIAGHVGFDAAVEGVTTSVIETRAAVEQETKMNDKDMELMQQFAEREAINRFTTKKINVDFSGMNNNFPDTEAGRSFIGDLRVMLEDALDSGSEGGE
ncbi:MAG: hypothetical protein IKR49_03345 [Clostridia bacterium]|nr:hypothetical protein [Clostridia bacterium]